MGLGVDLGDRDMSSSAQTDVEPVLAANVGLEHIETYIERRVDLSAIAKSALWLLAWTETDRGERRRAVGELLARHTRLGNRCLRPRPDDFVRVPMPRRIAQSRDVLIDCGRLRRFGRNVTVVLSWRPSNRKRAARGLSVPGDYLLHRASVGGRRCGGGVFLSAVSAARMRAIPRTAVCLEDGGRTPLEGILAQPRLVPDPRWTRKGISEGQPRPVTSPPHAGAGVGGGSPWTA
jgi:hypothetical protein